MKDMFICIARRLWALITKYTPIVLAAIWQWLRKWVPIGARQLWRFLCFVGRAIRGFVMTTAINPLRGSPKVWAFGLIWGIGLTLVMVGTYTVFYGPVESPLPEDDLIATCDIEEGPEACEEEGPEPPQARSLVRGIEPNQTQYVVKQYNAYVQNATWRSRTVDCTTKYWEYFERAERVTQYPAELIAGMALHESNGCQFIAATNGDGGLGPMQITTPPDKRELKRVAKLLGITPEQVDWRNDYYHNIIVGVVRLSFEEGAFLSRGVALLAYNRGGGNVRRDMARADLRGSKRRVISDFRGAIPSGAGKGGKPRIYVDRILAGVVMMDRVVHKQTLQSLSKLDVEDIPGSDPSKDGEDR